MLLSVVDPTTLLVLVGFLGGSALLINYALDVHEYHHVQKRPKDHQLPPKYPTCIPYLGTILSLLWDFPGFLQRAT